jgi:hypothetical protein
MEFLISSSSSIISSSVVYPIDLVKTQFQRTRITQSNITVNKLILQLFNKRGPLGFYRGMTSHLLTYPIFWGVYFQSSSIDVNVSEYKYCNKFIKSMIGSSIASGITNPLFVIKTRLQLENRHNINRISYPSLIRYIYNNEGVFGFTKGLKSTLINNTKLGLQFPLYDYLMEYINNVFLSSGLAKITASSIYYPFDIVRTNQRDSNIRLSITEALRKIYINNGIRGFYKGVMLYNLVTGPNFIIMMILKEYLTSMLNR